MRQYLCTALGFGLLGCGSEPPAFVEKPIFYMNVDVEGGGHETSDEVQEPLPSDRDLDAILADLEGASSSDAVSDEQPVEGDREGHDDVGTDTGTLPPPSGGSANNEEWASPDFSRPSTGEMKACARIAGVEESRLKIAGSKNQVTMGASSILIAKITGNQNRLALNFRGEAGTTVAGICLFLAGNQAEVELKSNLTIGRVFYTARGNQSRGLMVAEDSGNIEKLGCGFEWQPSVLKRLRSGAVPNRSPERTRRIIRLCASLSVTGRGACFPALVLYRICKLPPLLAHSFLSKT